MKKKISFFIVLLVHTVIYSKPLKIHNPFPKQYRDCSKRKSSYPYLTGDTFRSFCDHICDETIDFFDPSLVKAGDTIFLSHLHEEFFKTIVPHIKSPFIIVSHNGDITMPGVCLKYLDNPLIIAWWGVNVEAQKHPKLRVIPIGLANIRWKHGNTTIVQKIQKSPISKEHLLYLNITPETFPTVRNKVKKLFESVFYCHSVTSRPFEQYLTDLASSYFVLSPRGNGIDCHRTWEALLLGAIPIVQHSAIDSVYDELPVLIVNEWEEINETLLRKIYDQYSKMTFNQDKLYAQYWFDKINVLKEQIRKKNT